MWEPSGVSHGEPRVRVPSAPAAHQLGAVNLGGGIPHLRSPCGGEQPEGNLGTQRVAHGEPLGHLGRADGRGRPSSRGATWWGRRPPTEHPRRSSGAPQARGQPRGVPYGATAAVERPRGHESEPGGVPPVWKPRGQIHLGRRLVEPGPLWAPRTGVGVRSHHVSPAAAERVTESQRGTSGAGSVGASDGVRHAGFEWLESQL